MRVRRLLAGLLLAALPLAAAAAGAQTPALPDAAVLIARHDSMVGGRAALEAHQSLKMIGTFTIAAAGIDAPLEVLRRRPDRYVFRTAIAELGDVMQGYDGSTAWTVQPGQGAQILTGEAAARLAEQADFFGDLHDLSRFSSVETVGETDFYGIRAYKVRLTRASGDVLHEYFNVETGLSAGSTSTTDTPAGPQEITTVLGEYRDFGGLLLASRVVQRQPQYEVVIRIVMIEFDRLDEAALAPPAEVRALLERRDLPPATPRPPVTPH
jgi:hypothetical protein